MIIVIDEINPVEAMQDSQPVGNSDVEANSISGDPPEEDCAASQNRYECRSCGYVYDPSEGVRKFDILPGIPFLDLEPSSFKCPVCRVGMDSFRDIGPQSQPSGFDENLKYGLGINNLTPAQKNVLIFGGLAFALACFLSLYSLN